MPERECSDQPSVGFDYDYWFICTGCSERARITAEDNDVLEREVPKRKTIGLARLKELAAGPCSHDQLRDAVREAAVDHRRG